MPKDSGHFCILFKIGNDEGTEYVQEYAQEYEMSAGDYYLIIEVHWVEGTKDKSFALNCYSK